MMATLNKLFRHPIIATLVATVIIALFTSFMDWWQYVYSALAAFGAFFFGPVSVPVWLVVLLSLLALLGVVLTGVNLYYSYSDGAPERHYTKDMFYGLRWRWKYTSSGALKDPLPFCPECDLQIHPESMNIYNESWLFRCENCEMNITTVEEPVSRFIDRVRRQIQLRLRNGSWKESVERC